MKKLKLSRNEVNVVASVVSKKINDIKTEANKKLIAKDKMYLKWLKLNEERDQLQKQISEMHNEVSKVQREIQSKFKLSLGYNKDYATGEHKVSVYNVTETNNYYGRVSDDIVLMGIGNDLNVDELIDKLVDKYIK
jgi:uncharacterized coiled-coil DUF342 family protein